LRVNPLKGAEPALPSANVYCSKLVSQSLRPSFIKGLKFNLFCVESGNCDFSAVVAHETWPLFDYFFRCSEWRTNSVHTVSV